MRAGNHRPFAPSLALVASALLATASVAQETTPSEPHAREESDFSVRGSLGMTADPETFNMTVEAPVPLNDYVSVGPLMQLGFSDDHVLFGLSGHAYFTPPLEGDLEKLQPYWHLGMGLIHLEDDDRRPGRDDEDTEFLLTVGMGLDYEVGSGFHMGTAFLFNTIPGGAVGEKFVFGWQILTFRQEF